MIAELREAKGIRARRAPVAVLLLSAWELGWSLITAAPIHAWAHRTWGAHPDGDAVLFRPGGRELAVWIGSEDEASRIVLRTTVLLLVVGGLLGQVPLGGLVAALSRRLRPTSALAIGLRSWLPLSGLVVLTLAVQALLLGAGYFAGGAAEQSLKLPLGDGRAFAVFLVVLLLFGVAGIVVGVIADLARVNIVHEVAESEPQVTREPALTLLRTSTVAAVRTARERLGRALLAWFWRAALSVALLGAAWWAGSITSGRGGTALAGLFAFRQLVMVGRTALRASWLASALRLTLRRSDDT